MTEGRKHNALSGDTTLGARGLVYVGELYTSEEAEERGGKEEEEEEEEEEEGLFKANVRSSSRVY